MKNHFNSEGKSSKPKRPPAVWILLGIALLLLGVSVLLGLVLRDSRSWLEKQGDTLFPKKNSKLQGTSKIWTLDPATDQLRENYGVTVTRDATFNRVRDDLRDQLGFGALGFSRHYQLDERPWMLALQAQDPQFLKTLAFKNSGRPVEETVKNLSDPVVWESWKQQSQKWLPLLQNLQEKDFERMVFFFSSSVKVKTGEKLTDQFLGTYVALKRDAQGAWTPYKYKSQLVMPGTSSKVYDLYTSEGAQ